MHSPIRSGIKGYLFVIASIFSAFSCSKDKNPVEVPIREYTGSLKFTFVPGSIEKIFSAEKPWESKMLNYYNILRKDSTWYMWYNSYAQGELDFSGSFCLANSTNGKDWKRIQRTDNTNILISGKQKTGISETFVFMDKTDEANPYKMICAKLVNGAQKTFIYSSPDGIYWQNTRELYDMLQDTQFSVVGFNGVYYIFSRYNDFSNGYQRAVGLSTLDDQLRDLQHPKLLLKANPNDRYKHIYNNAASKVSDSCVLLFPTYYESTTNDIEIKLLYTNNMRDYYLVKDNIYADLFPQQTVKWAIISPGLMPTGEEKDTYWLYYYGTIYRHDDFARLPNLDVNYYRIKLRVH